MESTDATLHTLDDTQMPFIYSAQSSSETSFPQQEAPLEAEQAMGKEVAASFTRSSSASEPEESSLASASKGDSIESHESAGSTRGCVEKQTDVSNVTTPEMASAPSSMEKASSTKTQEEEEVVVVDEQESKPPTDEEVHKEGYEGAEGSTGNASGSGAEGSKGEECAERIREENGETAGICAKNENIEQEKEMKVEKEDSEEETMPTRERKRLLPCKHLASARSSPSTRRRIEEVERSHAHEQNSHTDPKKESEKGVTAASKGIQKEGRDSERDLEKKGGMREANAESVASSATTAVSTPHDTQKKATERRGRKADKLASPVSQSSEKSTSSTKPVFNIAGVNVATLLAEGDDPPPLYNRKQRRHTKRRDAILDDHPLFAAHRDLRPQTNQNQKRGTYFIPSPYATDEDVLGSLTEWTDSTSLVYAQLLWKYTPEAFLEQAMSHEVPTFAIKEEMREPDDSCVKIEPN